MDKWLLADLIFKLVEEADEARSDVLVAENPEQETYSRGRRMAYYEVLLSVQNALKTNYAKDLEDLGLNFDLDKLFWSDEGKVPLNLEPYI